MLKPIAGKPQTGANVLMFKVRMLSYNLFTSQVVCN